MTTDLKIPVSGAYRKRLLVILLLTCATTYGQENSQSINELLTQRSVLITSGESTTSVDLQLYTLGHVPKAVLSVETLPSGNLEVTCPLYRSYTPQNIEGMSGRLTSHYPYLISLQKGNDGVSVKGIFTGGTSLQEISEVINHFGYNGYETQH